MEPDRVPSHAAHVEGALLGLALGDALGLPYEGVSPRRAARLLPGPLRPRLLFGRGLGSDDLEHACLTGQSLLASGGDPARFAGALAWRLRGFLAALPAGIGWATLRACLKLCLFLPRRWWGVRSAGNGPAMRAPLLGVLAPDEARLAAWTDASTGLTHTDPLAHEGALAVALAARDGARGHVPLGPDAGLARAAWLGALPARVAALRGAPASPPFVEALARAADHLGRDAPPAALAEALGCARGVSGFILHTAPVALFCWLRRPADPRGVIEDLVALGGDADTTAAIGGGLAGATAGAAALPVEWLARLAEWPRTLAWQRRLAARLALAFPREGLPAGGGPAPALGPEPLVWPLLLVRNLLFALVVLAHGLRRLAPPY